MGQEIEIEFKNLLTKDEFDLLLQTLPFPNNSIVQKNHYFETKGFLLKKNKCALRIREKNNEFVLTLKEPHPLGLLETHDRLSKEEAKEWLLENPVYKPNVINRLEKLHIPFTKVQYYGCLTTERREAPYKEGLLVLDRSEYNGRTDYELELEVPDRETGLQLFEQLLHTYNIQKKPTENKIVRYFQTLSAQGKLD